MGFIFANAALITSIFYIVIIIFSKNNHSNKWWLVSFILLLNLSLIPILLMDPEMFPRWINASFGLLWGPFLYFYVLSLLKDKINYKWLIIHFLPFIIYFTLSNFSNIEILPGPPNSDFPSNQSLNYLPQIMFTVIQSISLLGYSILTLFVLNKHQKNIQNHYSYKDVYLTIRWSYTIIVYFVSAYIFIVLTEGIIDDYLNIFPGDLQQVLISSFIYILGYLGIKQEPVYINTNDDIENDNLSIEINEPSKEKYLKNKLNDDLKEEYKTKILAFIEREKPYLQAKLSINDLSKATQIPKHFISQVINDSLGQTFYSFINSYRVNEVKKRIQEDNQDKYTLLSIALDAGFNSKSGFNNNFKLETGMTPIEYKNTLKNSKSNI